MEGMTELPINWQRLLTSVTPETASSMLRDELAPYIIGIMELLTEELEQRRFLSIRQTVIRLVDFLNAYAADPCVACALTLKDDLVFECIDESVLRALLQDSRTLLENLSWLLQYLQETFLVYPNEQQDVTDKLSSLFERLITFSSAEENANFSPHNWKDAILF